MDGRLAEALHAGLWRGEEYRSVRGYLIASYRVHPSSLFSGKKGSKNQDDLLELRLKSPLFVGSEFGRFGGKVIPRRTLGATT